MKHSIPPGVFDIIPYDAKDLWKSSFLWNYVERIIREMTSNYGYSEIRTPLFERTELFQRSVGETSDIVSKEMYTFEDKGGRSLSLRPEGTAPAMRALIEHGLHQSTPIQKLYYISPMFRYERAQAGRYRQHHQFGVEAIGSASPEQDAELISLLISFYKKLGLKNLTLHLNSIGETSCRQNFRQALKDYLQPYFHELSADSQLRFESNPLRILDSKDPKDQKILVQAPSILNFLSDDANKHFEQLQKILKHLNIDYKINPKLVRGLDYYNKTVFEVTSGELGAQNSLGGGGRYDGLLKTLGGPDLPAIGFGTGIERIIQAMINQNLTLPSASHPFIYLIPMGEAAKLACIKFVEELRLKNIPSEMDFTGKKVGKSLHYADQLNSTYAAIIGDEELKNREIEIKEMASGTQIKFSLDNFVEALKQKMEKQS
ncbi:MAG: histidine--tRNA ligase [Parachlamydiaceae bacterium]|nr:histidine--tRNA ligase [Parachlamydiaceae bacterium]